MARRSGLGKGLGALIPSEPSRSESSGLREIALARIRPNPHQPRSHFDEEALASLVDSIRAVGVLQPVLVREAGDEEYELIAGERRCRAARRAGLLAIPALIQVADDALSLEQALVENLHREDLNPLDEAAAYQQLIEDFHLTHDSIAHRVGKSRAAISNALRLFQLPPAVQRLIRDGQLSAGHARALLMTPDRELQESLANQAVAAGLSVRALEELVHDLTETPAPEPPAEPTTRPASTRASGLRPPGVLELEELLAAYLNTRVRVELRANRGRVTVEFATLEDLERIYRLMIAEPSSRG
ncbi:MAG TPA: ParB/RepB/Spo0J family partition protein [Acidimicrobiales bacterium]|nr:ParB/RepB/Spo0J family partition protein [Acidimicrobiales bacterium]